MGFQNRSAGDGRAGAVARGGLRWPVRLLCLVVGVGVCVALPCGVAAGDTGSYTEPYTEDYTEDPPPEEGGGDPAVLEVCSEDAIGQGDLQAGTAESELRYQREQMRQWCRWWTGRLDVLLGILERVDQDLQARAEYRDDVLERLDQVAATLAGQAQPLERTANSTKYLADVFRGDPETEAAAVAVDPGPLSIDGGQVEVSNPADTQSVVMATERVEETVNSSIWGLAGLASGFGVIAAIARVVRP